MFHSPLALPTVYCSLVPFHSPLALPTVYCSLVPRLFILRYSDQNNTVEYGRIRKLAKEYGRVQKNTKEYRRIRKSTEEYRFCIVQVKPGNEAISLSEGFSLYVLEYIHVWSRSAALPIVNCGCSYMYMSVSKVSHVLVSSPSVVRVRQPLWSRRTS